jgi:hypothetical protein
MAICENQKYRVIKKQIRYRTWTAGPEQSEFSATLHAYFLQTKNSQVAQPIDIDYSESRLADADETTFIFQGEDVLNWTRNWVTGVVNTGIFGDRPAIEKREISMNLADGKFISKPKIFFTKRQILENKTSAESMIFFYPDCSLCWDIKNESLEIAISYAFS